MVTKGYQKGVYDRVTSGTSLAIAGRTESSCRLGLAQLRFDIMGRLPRLCATVDRRAIASLLPPQRLIMARWITWVSDTGLTGWACSQCEWNFPQPSLLSDPQAKSAFDRLASAKFRAHDCAQHGRRATPLDADSFADRARKLVMRGFKPKDAVEITLQEIVFESRNDPRITEKAQNDAEDFLRRVKEGLI